MDPKRDDDQPYGAGDGGTSDDDGQPDDAGQSGTLGDDDDVDTDEG